MLYTDFLFIFILVSTLVDTKLPLFFSYMLALTPQNMLIIFKLKFFVKARALMPIFNS